MTNSTKEFSKFREKQLKEYPCPKVEDAKDWQEERAIVQRRAFIEHDIKRKWNELNG